MEQNTIKLKKVGLLGGTFDPVHNGHLAVANHVLDELCLDTIWFIPAALPPHKAGHADGQEISGFSHRFNMLKRAIAGNTSFILSDIEAKRTSPSYSIDTINILIPEIGEQADPFFIIGADAFLEIDTWKQYKELPNLVNFVIISRPTYSPDKVGEVILNNFFDYTYDQTCDTWSSPRRNGSFILQHMEPVPISSTDIRAKVRNNENIKGLVPPAVEDYIGKHNLYMA
jgi:nicotinate-nucleotide adenylyltransferase